MNDVIDILGLIGSILVAISFIPQTYKTINSNQIKDISFMFMFINIISAGLMCIYGSYYYIIPIMISNGSVLTNCCIILYYFIYNVENNRLEEI